MSLRGVITFIKGCQTLETEISAKLRLAELTNLAPSELKLEFSTRH